MNRAAAAMLLKAITGVQPLAAGTIESKGRDIHGRGPGTTCAGAWRWCPRAVACSRA